jgi:serine/threonine protein kinase
MRVPSAALFCATGHKLIVSNPGGSRVLLLLLCAVQILALLNAYLTPSTSPYNPISTFSLFTPFYPYTLSTLIHSPLFLPSTSPSFTTVVHSLTRQMLSAVAYLESQRIAHRDINPHNFVLSRSGRIVLIDFGISIEPGDEKAGEMHFQVGTQ